MLSRFFGPGTGLATQADPFGTFQREMNRVFDEVFRGFPAMGRGAAVMGGFAPTLDVHETERGLELTAELPGMSENDIDLKLEGDLLSISGEKKQERTEEQGGMHLSERSYGRFHRAFRLPFTPDPQQVEARFDKGILYVTLPRPAQQQQGSRIQIRAGGTGAGSAGQIIGGGGAGAAQPSAGQPGSAATGPQPAGEQDNRPGRTGKTA
jgi:HSP20 family protein